MRRYSTGREWTRDCGKPDTRQSSGRRCSTGREWTRDCGKPDTRQMGFQGHHHHTKGTAMDRTKEWGTSPKDGSHHQKTGRVKRRGASTTQGRRRTGYSTRTNRRGRVDNQTIITRSKDWLSAEPGLGKKRGAVQGRRQVTHTSPHQGLLPSPGSSSQQR